MFRGLVRRLAPFLGFFFKTKALSEYATINLNQKKNNKTSLSFAFSTNFEFPKHLNSKNFSDITGKLNNGFNTILYLILHDISFNTLP